jgi:hypothetical protein
MAVAAERAVTGNVNGNGDGDGGGDGDSDVNAAAAVDRVVTEAEKTTIN